MEGEVVVGADEGCSILLDNPEGAGVADRVLIPAGEHSARIVRLSPKLGGGRWILLVFPHKPRKLIRGKTEAQWGTLWEIRDDFDFQRPDGTDYFT